MLLQREGPPRAVEFYDEPFYAASGRRSFGGHESSGGVNGITTVSRDLKTELVSTAAHSCRMRRARSAEMKKTPYALRCFEFTARTIPPGVRHPRSQRPGASCTLSR